MSRRNFINNRNKMTEEILEETPNTNSSSDGQAEAIVPLPETAAVFRKSSTA